MPNNQNRPYLLSNILGVIVAAYTLSNLLFITWCVPKMQAAERGAVCSFAEPLRILETNIPVIYRPVRFLKDSNNLGRADAVSLAYSFSWASALIAFIV